MSVERVTRIGGDVVWRVRWREGARNRSRVLGRKRDAEAFDAEVRRRRRAGELAALDAGRETLAEYVTGTWGPAYARRLAPATRRRYAGLYDLHIGPWLGHVPLRELTPELIARWQADLAAGGLGPVSVRKAVTLLGGQLQRAAEARRIPANPVRVVRKPRLPPTREVRPFAPHAVEELRRVLADRQRPQDRLLAARDPVLVSILAYAGLRPQEARGLRWGDVRDRTLFVRAPKTATTRTVRLLAPLAADLAGWRLARGRPGDDAPVICSETGGPWGEDGYDNWRERIWTPAVARAGLPAAIPYVLRHSFASLLLHEGRSVIYVARQLGHGAELTLRTYGHVIDELEDAPQLSAEDAIRRARERAGTRSVPLGARGTERH